MTSFLLLYKGPAMDMSSITPEQSKAVMDAWNGYFGKHGKAIKDPGNPTMPGVAVGAAADAPDTDGVNGYSIVEAADLAAVKAMMTDHPHLMDPRNTIDIHEIQPIM